MPHIDEGQLHAYLDGELDAVGGSADGIERHLAGCAPCRSRLEEARRIRGDAEAIVAGATPPAEEAPPFDRIRERAGSHGARGRARSLARYRGLRSLAWAASLVLALGLGWLARDMLRVDAPPASESPESLERFRSGSADAGAPPPGDRLEAEAEAASAREEAPARDARAEQAAGAEIDQTAPAVAGRAGEATSESRDQAGSEAPGGRPQLESLVVTGAQADLSPTEQNKASPAAAAAPAADGVPRRDREPSPSATPANVLDQTIAGSGWRPIDTDEAARILGGPLWRVDNRVVLGIAARTDGSGPLVRTTQRVDDYRLLELFQRPAPAAAAGAPAALDEPGPGATTDEMVADVSEVTVVRTGQVITARARLPMNGLEFLLRRLRPGR